MGVVYLGEDTRLGRRVALKFLPENLLDNDEILRRFRMEASTASSLNHPNICTIHDIDDDDHGNPFIVMEFLEGETLKTAIAGRSFSVEEAVDVASQIADALQATHARGLIHRDIKPANVFLTERGVVKLLDFGLAKHAIPVGNDFDVTALDLTQSGSLIGTANYMSPEQALGKDLDSRTDLFSLGAVFYEMLTGQQPFRGRSFVDTVNSIINKQPRPLGKLRPDAPAGLGVVLDNLLAKEPEHRYRDAAALLVDLRNLEQLDASGRRPAPIRLIKPQHAIAVLPFASIGGTPDGDEYFEEGLAEELISALSRVEGLRVVSRTSSFLYRARDRSVPEIGDALNVSLVLDGSVRRSGSRLRVTAQLVNAGDGYHLWSERYDREMQDVFEIQEEIAGKIVSQLKLKLVGADDEPRVKRHTANVEAYTSYLKGRYYWNKRHEVGLQKGIEFFQKAIAKDPNYPLPYAGLADSYSVAGLYAFMPALEAGKLARQAAENALRLDESLPEGHFAMALVRYFFAWELEAAETGFKTAIELEPGFGVARAWYGVLLASMGRREEAIAQLREAVRIDPLSPVINSVTAWAHYILGDPEESIQRCRAALELEPNYPTALWVIAYPLSSKGEYEEALAALRKGAALSQGRPFFVGVLGHFLAISGQEREARQILADLLQRSQSEYVAAYFIGALHLALGEEREAAPWLEKAVLERTVVVTLKAFVENEPRLESFRRNQLLKGLFQRMGLE